MGHIHRSKFPFSIPGRKAKPVPPPPPPPPPPSGPLTKAQKILGTGGINIDSPWEIRASPAISNAPISGAAHHGERDAGRRRAHHNEASASHERRWDNEPEAAPRNTGWQHNEGPESMNYEGTNTSHQQRRQSSSTVASYYDKQQQQLQQQQTQNSAMSKQLPSKAQQLLDYDNGIPETIPEARIKKKKSSMLDISSRLLKSKSSKHLKPDLVDYSAHVLGADMITNSPARPTTPEMSQQPMKRRTERTDYERYQQESYANSAGQEMYEGPNVDEGPAPDEDVSSFPAPPLNPCARKVSLSLFPPAPSGRPVQTPKRPEGPPSSVLTPSSLASPLADSASISSRHTRTSEASKRTDRSMTALDLQMNSVLSLSSDSEEDSYESSARNSLAVPLGEQGPMSPASTRSATSQPSSLTADYGRAKSAKRPQYGTQTQFLPIPEGAAAANVSKRGSRGSSQKTTSHLSTGSTSTSQTAMHGTPAQSKKEANATPPLSPTSVDVDFYLQNRSSETFGAYAPDNRSVYSGRSLGSDRMDPGRRASTASSIQDNASGRFMAVTRQEEMLLAALRQKRARMREDILAEYGDNRDGMDRDDPRDSRLTMMSENTISSSRVSRQSSASTMRLMDAHALNARPHGHQRPQIRISTGSVDKRSDRMSESSGQILVMMDRSLRQSGGDEWEPSPDLDGFMHFDDAGGDEMLTRGAFGGPYEGDSRRNSRSSLGAHSASGSHRAQRTPSSRSKASSRENSVPRRTSDQVSPQTFGHLAREAERRNRIVEAPEEDDMEDGIPRPDSPISPGDFPVPVSMLKKNVRLSAVGHY
ncbi:hypothetical protein B0H65DRAFT_222966 [Neurospora tetraspora]|uniref:Uncharacterized protein n=1 Tax=Neurospora tetraspora TaxID=94610 RepID=A0AAE0MQ96_9PEZI|nr:hypothetical protein B0H65DRAFT_222966 [Neurospora tetraspora]